MDGVEGTEEKDGGRRDGSERRTAQVDDVVERFTVQAALSLVHEAGAQGELRVEGDERKEADEPGNGAVSDPSGGIRS
jgi:hypothetical protein